MDITFGVGGVVTFKKCEENWCVQWKRFRLSGFFWKLTAPYMAPEPHRGTRNDSRNIPYIIAKIAEIKGVTPEIVEQTTRDNAFRLFSRVRVSG